MIQYILYKFTQGDVLMSKKSFKKGIHPYEGKELTKDSPIKAISAAAIMTYPMRQSIGAPAKPVVKAGDKVLKGQCIAEAGGFVSTYIHSAVSGTVKAVKKELTVNGNESEAVIIENDNEYRCVEGFGEHLKLDDINADEIIDKISKSGIVGLGGAGFPTFIKLTPKNRENIDTVIINGAECEPYLTSDYRVMLERTENIIHGIKAVLKVLPNAKAVIGIEDNKPEAIKVLNEYALSEYNIDVQPLKTKYPQGGERQLIYAVTGRKINSNMLPSDKNCIVLNISTCYAIYEAVYRNMPLIHRVMTITGEGIRKPCNVDVPIGISHADILESCGGARDGVVKYISGGPMMGIAMATLDAPVVKTSSSILAFTKDDVAALAESACIHCGKCLSACPEMLVPQMLAKAVKAENFERFGELGGMECIECGCCAFVCPAKIPLTQYCRRGKAATRSMKAKN